MTAARRERRVAPVPDGAPGGAPGAHLSAAPSALARLAPEALLGVLTVGLAAPYAVLGVGWLREDWYLLLHGTHVVAGWWSDPAPPVARERRWPRSPTR